MSENDWFLPPGSNSSNDQYISSTNTAQSNSPHSPSRGAYISSANAAENIYVPPWPVASNYGQEYGNARLYAQPRPEWTRHGEDLNSLTPGRNASLQSHTSAAPDARTSNVYSFVPIPGAKDMARPRRPYEELERIYKCGWNDCDKAYGTLNHLNAHVAMQSHGQRRTPEEFKEIRKEWKARKKAEEQQRKEVEAGAPKYGSNQDNLDGSHDIASHQHMGVFQSKESSNIHGRETPLPPYERFPSNSRILGFSHQQEEDIGREENMGWPSHSVKNWGPLPDREPDDRFKERVLKSGKILTGDERARPVVTGRSKPPEKTQTDNLSYQADQLRSETDESMAVSLDSLKDLRLSPASDDSEPVENTTTMKGRLAKRKSIITDRILDNILSWLEWKFTFIQGGNGPSNPKSHSKISTSNQGGSYSESCDKPGGGGRKRGRQAGGSPEDDGESGSPDEQERKRVARAEIAKSLFACPFFKHNPAKFKAHRVCCGPGWDSVHRVKEHIYRKHRQPKNRCNRCWEAFEDKESLLAHQRLPVPCQLQEPTAAEGIDEVQETRLRSRRREAHVVEEAGKWPPEVAKWRQVYRIIFAEVLVEDIPSPFYDYDKVYDTKGGAGKEQMEYFAEYKQYLLSRLRTRLDEQFDKDLRNFEVDMRRKAIDLVMNVQLEILSEFGSQSNEKPIKQNKREETEEIRAIDVPRPGGLPLAPNYPLTAQDFQFSFDDTLQFDFFDISAASGGESFQLGDDFVFIGDSDN